MEQITLTPQEQAQRLHEDIMVQERIASQSLTQIALDLIMCNLLIGQAILRPAP